MLATANRAKAREMAALLEGIPFRMVNLADGPGVTLPPEGESSYAENALAKARQAAVHDPAFRSLPRPSGERRSLVAYHDPRLMDVSDGERPHVLRAELVQLVRDQIGAVASFKNVDVVGGLPKTRSGKILRKTMREIADGKDAVAGLLSSAESLSARTHQA